ncbi:MAG: hypothetical protein KA218_00490 [Arenimonas sp.]|nr:hypothetical protein [Arenimonas sp.]
MTRPSDTDPFTEALSEISPDRIVKADAARLRYERRQLRLARRQRELAAVRAQTTVDPVARALAKALADAGDSPSG